MSAILVADDEPGFRDLYVFALEPLGYQVVAVSDGAEAVAQIATRAFDLVLLDQHMPKLTGLEALEQIRLLVPSVPVVMISADVPHQGEIEGRARDLGAQCCLFKPLELEQFVKTIQTCLSPQARS